MAEQQPINPKTNPFMRFSLAVYLASETTMEFLEYLEFHYETLNDLFFNPDLDAKGRG